MKRRPPFNAEAAVALILAALVLYRFLPGALGGAAPFWGDLIYIHHPWRALDAQLLMGGRLPLWNPYVYFGMPLAAAMQDSVFYPGTAPYLFFGFASATAIFHAVHYWLAGFMTFLWLRSLRISAAGAAAGAFGVCLGGVLLAQTSFLNHLAVLSLAPGLLLFFRQPAVLALVLSCAFLAGFPPLLIGSSAAAWAVALAFTPRRRWAEALSRGAASWIGASALALGFCACLLMPAVELLLHSRRAGGMALAESLRFGFSVADLRQWISPALSSRQYAPAVEWWKSCHLGFVLWLGVIAGLLHLPRTRAAALTAFLSLTVLLILGGSNPMSNALWTHVVALRYVRYPGNLSFLALPALALLAAIGIERFPRPGLWAAAAALELSFYAWGRTPQTSRRIFTVAGPLAQALRANSGDLRYILSPLALNSEQGLGRGDWEAVADWKSRLYGLSNAPLRLRSAANFGDPLAPALSYRLMDFLYTRSSAEMAAAYFPWAGINRLLTPGALKSSSLLRWKGRRLWDVYRLDVPSAAAYAFDSAAGSAIPAELSESAALPPLGRPLFLRRPREDRFSVSAVFDAPGWIYVSEPRYPGWILRLNGPGDSRPIASAAALTAFQKVQVPAGAWTLDFRYDPWTWRWGRTISVLSILSFAAYWRNKMAFAFSGPR